MNDPLNPSVISKLNQRSALILTISYSPEPVILSTSRLKLRMGRWKRAFGTSRLYWRMRWLILASFALNASWERSQSVEMELMGWEVSRAACRHFQARWISWRAVSISLSISRMVSIHGSEKPLS
jgi:hypothetical protein